MAQITLNVNGETHSLTVADPDMPLLYALRNHLGLTGVKFGCGLAQCGACTVLADGAPVRSCALPVWDFEGQQITTIEGLGSAGAPDPVQQAFIDEQVPQCGYCLSGWLMTAVALLRETENPTEEEIRDRFADLKCRCGTHLSILRAVRRAARQMA